MIINLLFHTHVSCKSGHIVGLEQFKVHTSLVKDNAIKTLKHMASCIPAIILFYLFSFSQQSNKKVGIPSEFHGTFEELKLNVIFYEKYQ